MNRTHYPSSVASIATFFLTIFASISISVAADVQLPFTKDTTTGPKAVWELENYKMAGKELSLKPYDSTFHKDGSRHGSATTTFQSTPGYYRVGIKFLDEHDGVSTFALHVDGKKIHQWRANGIFMNFRRTETIPHVKLERGSKIKITGDTDGTEFARMFGVTLTPDTPLSVDTTKPLTISDKSYSQDLVLLGDYRAYADPNRMIPPPSDSWGESRGGRQFDDYPLFYFKAKKGSQFQARVTAGNRNALKTAWDIRPAFQEAKAEPSGQLNIAKEASQIITYEVPADGIYELRLRGELTPLTHPLTRKQGQRYTNGSVYIFVPQGVQGFRLNAKAAGSRETGVVVKNSDDQIVWEGSIPSGESQDIRVPAEQSGKAWWVSYRSINPTVYIQGVPPYEAQSASALLVPRELLEGENKRNSSDASMAARPKEPKRSIDPQAIAGNAPRFDIVRDGRAVSTIAIADNADFEVADAARMLAQYLQEITGSAPAVKPVSQVTGPVIYVGLASDFPDIKTPDGFDNLKREGFGLLSSENHLAVLGRSPSAVRQGMITLLRRLGCRWYYPGQAWTILPEAQTVTVALNETGQPDFLYRRMTYGRSSPSHFRAQFDHWLQTNRMGSALRGGIQHSYANYVPYSLFEKHPEYFATRDTNKDGIGDKLTNRQPCTTHPDVVKMFTEGAKRNLDADPNIDILAISPNDNTYNMCRCERCRAVGSYSDCALLIVNQVARAVKEDHPNVLIGFYAYGNVAKAPTHKPPAKPENVLVELATEFNYGTTTKKMLENWPPYVAMVGIRDYFAINSWGADSPGGGLQPTKARRIIPDYYAHNARGVNGEAVHAWGGPGLGMYLATELMWDVDADADVILQRFYTDCFGAGAESMKQYFEFWDADKTVNERRIKIALQYILAAFKDAKRLDEQRRIGMYALYMHERLLRMTISDMDADESNEAFNQAIMEADIFNWRFKELGLTWVKSGWDIEKNGHKYFMIDEVIDIANEDLKRLKDIPAIVFTSEFSANLVPVSADVPAAPVPNEMLWIKPRRATNVIVRLEEDQEVTLLYNTVEKSHETKLSMKLYDSDAPEISRVTVVHPEATTRATLKANKAGLYVITASSDQFTIDGKMPFALTAGANPFGGIGQLEMSPDRGTSLFFFVPEKTEGFGVRTNAVEGRTMTLIFTDGRGKIVEELNVGSTNHPVIVPQASRGQVWRMDFRPAKGVNRISIKGVPPYFSTDPKRLLVPDSN